LAPEVPVALVVRMIDPSRRDADLALAHRLADLAGTMSLSFFRRNPRQWSKADGSVATEADLAVEDALRACIDDERPGDAVLGEECGLTGSGARRWIVDAIDGTDEFVAGTQEWAVLIALEIDGRVSVGVCDQPAYGRRYWATRGGGAFRRLAPRGGAEPLRVSTTGILQTARSYVPPPQWIPGPEAQAVASALAAATRPVPNQDHPALQIAAARSDLAVYLMAGPWDLAAPALLVEEAGGRFTDLNGQYDLASGTAMFSNGLVHDDALAVVARRYDTGRDA
jgi:histidinol-phosphatase